MKPMKNFAAQLKDILTQMGLSASALSRRMGFNSRNSLFRILNDEASYDKQKEFFQGLKAADILQLSDSEWSMLEESLEVSRVGVDSYVCNQAMAGMVMHEYSNTDAIQVRALIQGSRDCTDEIGDFFGKIFGKGQDGRLLIVGCCDLRLFKAIAQAFWISKDQSRVEITHYIEAEGAELVQVITAIQPVIYAGCYQAYMLSGEKISSETRDLYRGNFMLASYEDEDGKRHYLHFILSDYGRMYCYEYENEMPYRFIKQVFTEHQTLMTPVKTMFMQPAAPEDYVWYTESYRKLEEDCNLYCVKSDVPINYIHPDILLAPVVDGFKENGFGKAEEQEQLIGAFYDIALKRWENFFRKHKVTHTIFTYESMCQFARTGRQSDHFFAMRPYTREERKEILRFLKDQTENNPYFTIHFFKPGLRPVQSEIGMYEGKGVLLTKEHTDYKLDGEHAEALVTQPEYCAYYKDYFLKQLLVNSVTSAKETLMMMDELIGMCE